MITRHCSLEQLQVLSFVFAVEFFDKVVKIDDPVGAISVHGVCGALGTLFTGIFGEGCSFITQMIGFVAVAAYTLILAFILFFVLKKTIGLRVTEKEEIDGLDMHEHGCSAYANFHFHNDNKKGIIKKGGADMKKLTVIVKPANREDVIDIMESCAVYGVMETDITGYGNQKGYRVMYRGTMSGPNVLMKCKFETVGDDKTIEVLKGFLEKKLCTGNIGDGKIFVEKVADVIRVRTGQRGEEAL